jgi:hypothetical protein
MRPLTQATLTAGKRTLVVGAASVSVFPSNSGVKSRAAWVMSNATSDEYVAARPWVTYTNELPAELRALIRGVLAAECPLQPLMDWVIENGPANLAAEVEAVQTAVLNGQTNAGRTPLRRTW